MKSFVFRSRILRLLTLTAFLVVMIPTAGYSQSVEPVTYWVDAVNGDDGNLGTAAEPFKTITHALLLALADDTVMVEPGVYDSVNGETFPLVLSGQTLMSTSGAEDTIIAGDGVHNVMVAQNFIDGDVIKGFTIANGAAGPGAGLQVYLNYATSPGWPRIEGNTFTANESSFAGGALQMFTSAPISTGPEIVGNSFVGNSASDGGAVRLDGQIDATFEDNLFEGNIAMGAGGAICSTTVNSVVVTYGNTFVGNSAGTRGGAVYMSDAGSMEIISLNEFIENEALLDGGAVWLYGANASMSSNEAAGNHSRSGRGGFAYLEYTSLDAKNNIIGGHSAAIEGAAWYLTYALLQETNDTVVECFGTDSAAYPGVGGQVDIYNSIYWNPSVVADVENAYIIEYSCLYDSAAASHGNIIGSGVIYDDPQFIDLPGHDARLGLGSPCVDTANTALGPAGDFFGTLRPQDGDGDGSAVTDMGYFEKPPLELTALQGEDRYDTAVQIASETFDACDYAVLASGENYPDALSAAGLAGAYDCPLVLTRTASLPGVTADFLTSRGVQNVIVVGGTGAVSDEVYDLLATDFTMERIAGVDRYDTAAKVADAIATHEGSAFSGFTFIARGDSFADALPLSALAYANRVPILLTRPTSLPGFTADALDALGITEGAVAGGVGAVDAATKNAIDAIVVGNGGTPLARWAGDDRYHTAAVIAGNAVMMHMATWDYVGIATGQDYPDALAGGARTGVGNGVVLLTRTDLLPTATADALSANADAVLYTDIFGGVGVVSAATRAAIEDALGW